MILDDDGRAVIALVLFAYLFPPSVKPKVGFNDKLKPSKAEQQAFFCMQVDSNNNYVKHIEKYAGIINKKKYNEKLNPIGVVVGKLDQMSELKFFLHLVDNTFVFQDVFRGFFVFFFLFFMLNTSYPPQASYVLLFFQNYLFKIRTEKDKDIMKSGYNRTELALVKKLGLEN